MTIVMFLGRNVKEYREKSAEIIEEAIKEGAFMCPLCLQPMKRHSDYKRSIKETGEQITITMIWCRACSKWRALLPDFMLPGKHYSGNEIEGVLIDSATEASKMIETEASESTVRRWIKEVGQSVRRAVGLFKYLFGHDGHAVSEVAIVAGSAYSELEQVLEMAPDTVMSSGNRLGIANIRIGASGIAAYI
jgi:hypothetical protein